MVNSEGSDGGNNVVVLDTAKVDKRRGPRGPRKPKAVQPAIGFGPQSTPQEANDALLMIHALTHGWKAIWYDDDAFKGWVWLGPCNSWPMLLIPGNDHAPNMTEALREALRNNDVIAV